jgi:tetratricopeptide (TPR) repeat protein
MRMYEEALSYRPCDLAINQKAAELALKLRDLDTAREYAEAACELNPESAAEHRRLGKVLALGGLKDRAALAYERALQIEPGNSALMADLKALRRNRVSYR